ncbi:MAG: MoaD/ThiS family protein [Dehalococcoidia bacterium]
MKVVYDALFSDVARQHEEIVRLDGATLRGLIGALTERYGPGFGELVMDPQGENTVPGVAILVNGRRLALDSPLSDGDEVAFLRPIAGG